MKITTKVVEWKNRQGERAKHFFGDMLSDEVIDNPPADEKLTDEVIDEILAMLENEFGI